MVFSQPARYSILQRSLNNSHPAYVTTILFPGISLGIYRKLAAVLSNLHLIYTYKLTWGDGNAYDQFNLPLLPLPYIYLIMFIYYIARASIIFPK